MKICTLLSFKEAVGSLYNQIILSRSLKSNLKNLPEFQVLKLFVTMEDFQAAFH